LLKAIGAVDVGAQSLARPYNTLTAESLAALNPDVILVMSKGLESVGGVQGLLKLPGVAQTKAGRTLPSSMSMIHCFCPLGREHHH
jgi:iron complex transport system substrate-binding protein